jgi:hypothetical protein
VKIDVEGYDCDLVARVCSAVPESPVLVVEANAGVAEAAAAGGLEVVPTHRLLAPSDAALANVSDDLIAYPRERIDLHKVAERVRAEAARLRVRPRVAYTARRSPSRPLRRRFSG